MNIFAEYKKVNGKNGEIYGGILVVLSVWLEKVNFSLYFLDVLENCFEGRLRNVMYMGIYVYY